MVTKSTANLPKEGATMKQTEKNVEFAKGGNTPMFGHGDRTTTAPHDAANPKKPGDTDQADNAGGSSKFAAGGTNKMFGYAPSEPARGGITSAR